MSYRSFGGDDHRFRFWRLDDIDHDLPAGRHMTGVAAAERKTLRVFFRLVLRIAIVMVAGGDLNLEPIEPDMGDVPAP